MNTKIVYPQLGYKIQGAIFKIYKSLGPFHKEVVYQRALAKEFEKLGLKFEQKKAIPVLYDGEKVGVYQPDFVIEDKVLIELKAQNFIPPAAEKQFFYYIAGTTHKLALLVNFGQPGKVYIKRWVK